MAHRPSANTDRRRSAMLGGRRDDDPHLRRAALSVELIDQLSEKDVDGIRPLKTDRPVGVIFAPLSSRTGTNTILLLVLGFLDAGRAVLVCLGHRDHLILGGLGNLIDRVVGSSCGPTDHRRLWPDLWLAGSYWCYCAQGMGYRHWAGGLFVYGGIRSARCRCWASVVACHGRVI